MAAPRLVFALCAVVATLAGGGVPSISAAHETRTPESSAAKRPPPILHLGHRGVAVRTLQERLIRLGYLPPGAAGGVYEMRTWHAVVAFQGWQRLKRDGIVGRRTRVALASAHRPRPWVSLNHGLELDLGRQVLLVVDHGQTRRAIHISSAAPGYATPRGRFDVFRRERMSWSVPYRVWMPYALYFSGGYAIHGFDPVPAYPASHGCVRMPLTEAPLVYGAAPLHTPVVIR
jgi:hypothetical protein